MCLDNSCQPNPATGTDAAGGTADSRYSGPGESCQAKNDCASSLACIMATCRPVDIDLPHTPKNCYRVECAEKADCCTSFVPNANCEEYKRNCDDDPVFCNTYRNLCECNQDCTGEMCVAATPGCASDGECTSEQTPFCIESKCTQCKDDVNCQGQGTRCIKGTCAAPCMMDENCPMLQECQSGSCVEVGCKTDRECVFLMRDALAACRDAKCQVPCLVDTDCSRGSSMTTFQVCEQGQCLFVGCENDAECRALLGLQNSNSRSHAVCKEPVAAAQ